MIISNLAQVRIFEIIHAHGKSLGDHLSDKRVDHPIGFTASWSPDHQCSTERIYKVDPSFVDPLFVIKFHGDIHRMWRNRFLLWLHKGFPLNIPFILSQTSLDQL